MEAAVPAMRMGNLKFFFITAAAGACRDANGEPRTGHGKKIYHDPPLVFDISKDPGENTPVDPATITAEIAKAKQEYNLFWTSVNATMKSTTSYVSAQALCLCL